jgi:drug/metabolite transporter (DMT)-like permease
MTLSMFGFAIEDVFLKILSETIPVSQILIYVGGLAALSLGVLSKIKKIPILRYDAYSNKLFVTRSISDMIGAVLMVTAISLMPLSTISSILQTVPLFITFGAVLIFKEKVGWRRWSAIFIGFIGVILILKPGIDGFHLSSLVALLAVAFLALRDLVTRKINNDIHSITIFGQFVSLTVTQWLVVFAITLFGVFSYLMLVLATRRGDISVISPFRYTRLVFALILAMLILNERPDILTLLGAAIIVVSGYYTIWRERVLGT